MASAKAAGMLRLGRLWRGFRLLRTVRLLRLMKLRDLFVVFHDHITSDYTSTLLSMVKYVIFIISLNHVIACVWFKLGSIQVHGYGCWVDYYNLTDRSVLYQYATSLHWSLTQFTPASMDVQPRNTYERVFAVTVLMFALCVFSSFVSSITTSMTRFRNLTTEEDHQFWILRQFLRERNISMGLSARIQRYIRLVSRNEKDHSNQASVQLLNKLSGPLHLELQYELYQPILEMHPCFEVLSFRSPGIIRKVCDECITALNLSKGDVLFEAGECASMMFFQKHGLAKYEHVNIVMGAASVKPGMWFCEAVLWTTWVFRGRMKTRTECELLGIISVRFREALQAHPSLLPFAAEYGHEFVTKLNTTPADMLSDISK